MIKFPLVFIYLLQVFVVLVLVLYFKSSVLFASFAYQFANKMKVSLNRLYCLLKISYANFLFDTKHRLIFTELAESSYDCIFFSFSFFGLFLLLYCIFGWWGLRYFICYLRIFYLFHSSGTSRLYFPRLCLVVLYSNHPLFCLLMYFLYWCIKLWRYFSFFFGY